MAKVSVWDNDGIEHIKEPVDARECVEKLGWSNSKPEAKVVEQVKAEEPVEEVQVQKKRGPKSRGDE